ncbi:seven transmembrane MLO family protein [Medicago truncatula]|uniref:Seven transmembrane MLO family protein n=1 Tax=Medicago truncatula TaxID=3880 RepID=G7IJV9_MEDTR|nr:seven transmembrane MLO family protein [Medicago truncatula]
MTMSCHPSDKYFWFGKPRFVLYLLHFSLFESAFQISSFGRIACLDVGITPSIFKITLGFGKIFICNYVSLPLYALITGTRKRSTSDELGVSSVGSMHGSITNHSSRFIDGRPTSMALMRYIWTTRRGMRNEEFVDEMQVDDDVGGSYDTQTPISRSIIR